MIKLDFEFQTKYGMYRDALHLADDHTFTPEQIIAMQNERVTKWIQTIENPPSNTPETVDIDGVQYEEIEINGYTVLKPIKV